MVVLGAQTVSLPDFQLMFTPKAFAAERARWRPLIHLNLIRSILVLVMLSNATCFPINASSSSCSILDNLNEDPSSTDLDVDNYLSLDPTQPTETYSRRVLRDRNEQLLGARKPRTSTSSEDSPGTEAYPYPGETQYGPVPPLSKEHRQIKMRLSPLIQLQDNLIQNLAGQFGDDSPRVADVRGQQKRGELLIRGNSNSWKGILGKRERRKSGERPRSSRGSEEEEAAKVLYACKDDMVSLWRDPVVREILHRRDVRLEEGPGL